MRTIAITSGKGGVGKTNLSANLGIAVAARGKSVVVFDADLGLANLDVVLGTKAQFTLQHVLAGEKQLSEIVMPGPGGVKFIAGGSGVQGLVNLNGPQLERFLMELSELEKSTDILLLDTGAGIDQVVMTFIEAADETIVVTTPDPASITDAYATIKTLYGRKPSATVRMVINMVSDETQARAVFAKVQTISQQFLSRTLIFGGHVRQDPRAIACIRSRRPFVLADSTCPAAQDVIAVAGAVLGEPTAQQPATLAERFRSLFSFGIQKSA